jgi:hypothetical protein
MSRTHPRHRWAGSASLRGCQSSETVSSGVTKGRGKVCIPARSAPVCRSGTVATRLGSRARKSALQNPLTMVTIVRSRPTSRGSHRSGLCRAHAVRPIRACRRHNGQPLSCLGSGGNRRYASCGTAKVSRWRDQGSAPTCGGCAAGPGLRPSDRREASPAARAPRPTHSAGRCAHERARGEFDVYGREKCLAEGDRRGRFVACLSGPGRGLAFRTARCGNPTRQFARPAHKAEPLACFGLTKGRLAETRAAFCAARQAG